jgi:surface protein
MSSFFSGCKNLSSIDLSKFDISNVVDISGMFSHCENMVSLNLSSFDTKNVVEMEELFLGCVSLKNVTFSNKFIFDKVEDMSYMFADCENLTEIKLGNTPNTFYNLKSIQSICHGCTKLEKFDFNVNNNDNTSLINISDMSSAFADCINLNEFVLDNINTKFKIGINIDNMFLNCESLAKINFSSFFIFRESLSISNMQKTFKNCKKLSSIDFSLFDLSNVYDFSEAFYGCISLISLDLSKYNFTLAYYMDKMFYGCSNLISIQLPNYMESVFSANNIFAGCEKLKEINLDNFQNSKKFMNIKGMFKNCSCLQEINLKNIETRYLVNAEEMFYGCTNLKSINFNTFNTDRIKNMEKMFYDCNSLKFLNISNFRIPKEVNIKNIFEGVPPNKVDIYCNEPKNISDDLTEEIIRIVKNDSIWK